VGFGVIGSFLKTACFEDVPLTRSPENHGSELQDGGFVVKQQDGFHVWREHWITYTTLVGIIYRKIA
jgi:hypothetical protein